MNSQKISARVAVSIIVVLILAFIILFFAGPIIGSVFFLINSSISGTSIPPADEPTFIPAVTVTPGGTEVAEASLAVPETRRLTLEYPPRLKAGTESDVIILTIEVDGLGNISPTAQFPGNVTEGEIIEIPNLYETHYVTAEAQFDIAGLEVKPGGATYQPLKQGKSITFQWSVRAQEVGTYRGTVWLYLNFEDRSSGEKSRIPVSAQIVEIEAVDLFGFSVNFVRTSGVVGSVLGIIVGFPFFEDIVKYLWAKRKKGLQKVSKPARKK